MVDNASVTLVLVAVRTVSPSYIVGVVEVVMGLSGVGFDRSAFVRSLWGVSRMYMLGALEASLVVVWKDTNSSGGAVRVSFSQAWPATRR